MYSEVEVMMGIEVYCYGVYLFYIFNVIVWEYVNCFIIFMKYVYWVYFVYKGVVYLLLINFGMIN